jgi:hypothetical protein
MCHVQHCLQQLAENHAVTAADNDAYDQTRVDSTQSAVAPSTVARTCDHTVRQHTYRAAFYSNRGGNYSNSIIS